MYLYRIVSYPAVVVFVSRTAYILLHSYMVHFYFYIYGSDPSSRPKYCTCLSCDMHRY